LLNRRYFDVADGVNAVTHRARRTLIRSALCETESTAITDATGLFTSKHVAGSGYAKRDNYNAPNSVNVLTDGARKSVHGG
jgi:hypothetical protein